MSISQSRIGIVLSRVKCEEGMIAETENGVVEIVTSAATIGSLIIHEGSRDLQFL